MTNDSEEEFDRIRCLSEEEWLSKRVIGGSSASAIVNQNPYRTNLDAWKSLTGRKADEDISGKDCVIYGKTAEDPIRRLFAARYANEFDVIVPKTIERDGYIEMFQSKKHPFMTATLDGQLIDKNTGELGVLEIKTANIISSIMKERWNGQVPQNYYIQVLHYLMVCGKKYKFAILYADLSYGNSNGESWQVLRPYIWRREEEQQSIDYLEREETNFWKDYVETDKAPDEIVRI